jgi:hypothetical protein
MPRIEIPVAVAILDDYQNVARALADWSCLNGRATITVFNSHLTDSDALIERLKPFDVVCVRHARTHRSGCKPMQRPPPESLKAPRSSAARYRVEVALSWLAESAARGRGERQARPARASPLSSPAGTVSGPHDPWRAGPLALLAGVLTELDRGGSGRKSRWCGTTLLLLVPLGLWLLLLFVASHLTLCHHNLLQQAQQCNNYNMNGRQSSPLQQTRGAAGRLSSQTAAPTAARMAG